MVWSHYVDATRSSETTWNSDDDNEDQRMPPRNRPLDYQDWITWYSNDLLNIWMSLRAYREDTGNAGYLLDRLDWCEFCEFCYRFSSKLPSSMPS